MVHLFWWHPIVDQSIDHIGHGQIWLVFESPVSGLEKDQNWTGLDQKKDWTAVLVFDI
jgi:hypothetical protein